MVKHSTHESIGAKPTQTITLIKGKIQQEDIASLTIYISNTRGSKFIKEALKSQIDPHTLIVGNCNISLSI